MNHLLVLMSSLSLGGMAWGMLVVSDWLLGDNPRLRRTELTLKPRDRSGNRCDRSERTRKMTDTSRRIAPTTISPRAIVRLEQSLILMLS